MAEKLIRHRIPALAAVKGEKLDVRIAEPHEMPALLKAKLAEEVAEFLAAPTVEELADVIEVVRAIKLVMFDDGIVAEAVQEKRFDRGDFLGGIVLKTE